jgi:RNA polymerase sigma factor (sigma-70 family)
MDRDQVALLQIHLDRLRSGDRQARDELIRCACGRLESLTRVMLRDYARLKRWEQTDDVLQSALLRLTRCLEDVVPETIRDFFRLATLQIRRELIDLSRHYYRPDGQGARHSTAYPPGTSDSAPPAYEQGDSGCEPSRMTSWTELHRLVEGMPEEDREIFDLLWYQGLSQPEASRLLGMAERTLKRRWQAIRLRIHQAMKDDFPT